MEQGTPQNNVSASGQIEDKIIKMEAILNPDKSKGQMMPSSKPLVAEVTLTKQSGDTPISGFSFFLVIFFGLLIAGLTIIGANQEVFGKTFEKTPFATAIEGKGKIEIKEEKGDFQSADQLAKITEGESIRTDQETRLILTLNDEAVIRLDKNTEIEILTIKMESEEYKKVFLKLKKGKLWINNILSELDINILVNKTVLIPDKSSVNIVYDDKQEGRIEIYADRQNTLVVLLSKSIAAKEELIIESDNPLYLNKFLLTESNQVVISENKISDKLIKLKYSKLIKEFPFSLVIDEDIKKNEWFNSNRKQDNLFLKKIAESRKKYMTERKIDEIFVFSPKVNTVITYLRKTLTIDVKKRVLGEIKLVFDSLHRGELALIRDDIEAGDTNLAVFKNLMIEVNAKKNEAVKTWFQDNIKKEINFLSFVVQGTELYKAKMALREVYLTLFSEEQQFEANILFNRDRLGEIMTLLRDKPDNYKMGAITAVNEYQTNWNKLASLFKNKGNKLSLLEEERQILQSILFRYMAFYEGKYFEVVNDLEQVMIAMTATPNDKNDMSLNFINDKLKTLARLVYLVKEKKMPTEGAIALGKQLMDENNDLMPENAMKKVAVSDYFVQQMDEFKLLLDFFESPTYKMLHGDFDNKVFEKWKITKKDYEDTKKYIAGIKTDSKGAPRANAESLKNAVKNDFAVYKIEINKIDSLEDPQARLFQIGEIKCCGKNFAGKYDRDKKLVYDFIIDKKTYSSAVSLSDLKEMISSLDQQGSSAGTKIVVDDESSSENNTETEPTIESVAKMLVLNDLEVEKILATDKNIQVIDLNKNTFKISDVYSTADKEVIFSFDYDQKNKEVNNVKLKMKDGGIKAITGKMTLKEVKKKAAEVYNQE